MVIARIARPASWPPSRPPSAGLKVRELVTIDGFQFRLEDGGWMLIRFSGTEPIMRVYCETRHADKVQAISAGRPQDRRTGLILAGACN